MLQPQYEPPKLRKALIVELEAPPESRELTNGRLHYLEGSLKRLRLDMCSILPKQGHFTITLIGASVDEASCGVYWRESGTPEELVGIMGLIDQWAASLRSGKD